MCIIPSVMLQCSQKMLISRDAYGWGFDIGICRVYEARVPRESTRPFQLPISGRELSFRDEPCELSFMRVAISQISSISITDPSFGNRLARGTYYILF